MPAVKFIFTQLGRIGDMILLTSVFDAVKSAYAECEIDVIAGRHNSLIIEGSPLVGRLFVFEKSPLKLFKFMRELKSERYDFLVDPKDHESAESCMIATFVNARKKIGFNPHGKKVFDVSVPPNVENEDIHFIDRCFSALAHAGVNRPALPPRPKLFPNPESIRHTGQFLERNSVESFVLVNISAGNPERLWQRDKWSKVVSHLESMGKRVIINSVQENYPDAEYIISRNPGATRFPASSILDTIALASRASLIITPDTSLVHIASAFDVPLLGLFDSDNYNFNKFRPLSSRQKVIRSAGPVNKIAEITPEEVISAINSAVI